MNSNVKNRDAKMFFVFRFSLLIFLLCVFATNLSAQTTEFTYQGRLLDNSLPATADYDFQFSLWDALANGTQVGSIQIMGDVPVANGIFTVRLDFGSTAFTDGGTRFLQIEVRPGSSTGAYATLAPRQTLTSAPFAIRAQSAARTDLALDSQKLGGLNASEYVTTASVENAFVKNDTALQTANFNIDGSGLIGGNLGIGTKTPRARLDVAGNAVQDISNNGFVKAMALINVVQTPQGQTVATVARCFNGVLNSSTGSCGFTVSGTTNTGGFRVRVDFGFTVDTRFVSFTELDVSGNNALQTSVGRISFFNPTTVQTVITGTTGRVFIFVY